VSRKEAVAAAERLGVGLTLLYELVARFRRRPQTSSLVPGVRGRVACSRSLDPRVEALVASAIKEVYPRPEPERVRVKGAAAACFQASERTMFEGGNNVGSLGKPGEKTLMHLLRT
jgi:hypothetical protein